MSGFHIFRTQSCEIDEEKILFPARDGTLFSI